MGGGLALVAAAFAVAVTTPVPGPPPRHAPPGREEVIAFGTLSAAPAFAAHVPAEGTLRVDVIDRVDGRVVAGTTTERARLPAPFAVTRGDLPPETVTHLREGLFFVTARLDGGAGPAVSGELWGPAGKPTTARFGARMDLELAAFAEPAPLAPTPAPADDPDDPVLVFGTIAIDPRLEAELPPGGTLHLQVVHADWGRPFLFRRFEDAHFPLSFVIRAREQFYPKGLEAAREGRHFVEAFYNPPGVSSPYGTFAMDPAPLTGEAWGARGKPAPLALGERADVVLAGWRVQGVERGVLTPVPRALLEGWILVPHALRSEVSPDNRVTLAVIAPPPAPGGTPRLLAAKVYENMDPEAPIAFHVLPEDLRDGALDGNTRAYFVVRVECFGDDGAVVRYLEGGRASPATPIAPFVDDLQVAVTRVKRRDPLAYLEGLRGLPSSPITLR